MRSNTCEITRANIIATKYMYICVKKYKKKTTSIKRRRANEQVKNYSHEWKCCVK